MDNADIRSLVDELLKKGDIKYYSSEGDLVSLAPGDGSPEDEECLNYVKSVEHDFRNNASDILKNLELSHLHIKHTD